MFDLATRRIRIHDVIRAYLRGQSGEALAQLNVALVEGYRTCCAAGWATGPNDGYYFQYLPWHLVGAGRQEELRSLLLDYAWMEAKLRATDVGALLADYQQFSPDRTVSVMGQALRLSAHALARDPELLLGQLLGRIDRTAEMELGTLLEHVAAHRTRSPWLRPRTASLTRPGGPLLQTVNCDADAINAVALVTDATAVAAGHDGTLTMWNLVDGKRLATLRGHTDAVTAVLVTPDRTSVITGGADHTIRVWDLATRRLTATLEGHVAAVNALSLDPGGKRVVSGAADGAVKLWDLESGHAIATFEGHTGSVNAVAVTVDGKRALSGGEDGTVRVWELASGARVAALGCGENVVSAIAVTPDGRSAIVGGRYYGTLILWDLATLQTTDRLEIPREWPTGEISALAVTGDGMSAVSGGSDSALVVWDLQRQRAVLRFTAHDAWIKGVAVTANGMSAVSGSMDGTLKVWDLSVSGRLTDVRGELVAKVRPHTESVTAAAITPEGTRAVTADEDGIVAVWYLHAPPL